MSIVGAAKQLARKAGLGPVVDYARRTAPIVAFRALDAFRPSNNDGRCESRIGHRVAAFDTFPFGADRFIALIGHYRNLPPTSGFTCRFSSGAQSTGVLVDDTSHEIEGQQVLVVLFPVPPEERAAGRTRIDIDAGDTPAVRQRPIEFGAGKPRHHLAVTTLMKDEDPFLREWIEYYRLLGADHFYIYDNRSLHRTAIRRLLRPYVDQGIVTLLDWDYPYISGAADNSWRYCQRGQMHHCLYKYGQHSTWMLFIDVDEFVYPLDPGQMSLLPLLEHYEADPTVAALQFKMIWFGDSEHEALPDGLVIENYVRRAREPLDVGREKCVVKPALTELMFIHDVKRLAPGSRVEVISPSEYRLNHYFATSSKRRHVRRPEFNEVIDSGMQRFAQAVSGRCPALC